MKHISYIASLMLFFFVSCAPQEKPNDSVRQGGFAKGADISWLTEQESDGIVFYNQNNQATDCFSLLKSCGMNAARFRVWVNHSTGWCNKEDLLEKAKRADALQMRLMIDFHYSDFFCDPSHQEIPEAWKDYDINQMCEAVSAHTLDVLQSLQAIGITPEWVQVGNETTNGMLWPMGMLWDNNGDLQDGWKRYVALSNSGYDAVKRVFPAAKVVIHIDNAWEDRLWWYKKFAANGGKFDIIGLSHYPQTNSQKSWSEMNTLCAKHVDQLAQTFNVPVIIAEVGTKSANPSLAAQVMTDFVNKVCPSGNCAGVFYWEPQVYNGWKPAEYNALGWGPYDMGAFLSDGQPAEALKLLFSVTR